MEIYIYHKKRQVKSNADVVDDDGVAQSGRCFIFAYYIYDMRLEKWNWNVLVLLLLFFLLNHLVYSFGQIE